MPKIYDENGIATEIDDSIYYSLEDLPGEEWKDIIYFDEKKGEVIDFSGMYQISNKGRVKSLLRYGGKFGNLIPEKILVLSSNSYQARLSMNSKPVKFCVRSMINAVYDTSNGRSTIALYSNQFEHNRPVICITTGQTYPSILSAEKETGIHQNNIQACCRRRVSCSGRLVDGRIVFGRQYRNKGIPLIWRYMEDVIYEG